MGHTGDCSGKSVSSDKSPDFVVPAQRATRESMRAEPRSPRSSDRCCVANSSR